MNITKICWALRAIAYKCRFHQIGKMSYLGKPIFLSNTKNITIGERVRIYPGMRAEIVNKSSYLTLHNNISIGQNFHVVSYNDELNIESNVTISGNVLITNCDHGYKEINTHILDQKLTTKKTIVGDGCFIGYGAVIQAGTKLGRQCIVGANAVVRGEFGDYEVIAGAPARCIRKFNPISKQWERV